MTSENYNTLGWKKAHQLEEIINEAVARLFTTKEEIEIAKEYFEDTTVIEIVEWVGSENLDQGDTI